MAIKNDKGQVYTEELGGILLAKSIDDRTEIKAIAVEPVQERAVELGLGFNVSILLSITAASSEYISLVTPAEGYKVTLSNIGTSSSQVATLVTLHEGSTISDGTDTGVYVNNICRSSTNTAQFTVKENPTVTEVGNVLAIGFVGLTGESVFATPSYQLKQDETYLFKIDNVAGTTATIVINFQCYQIPN